MREFNWCKGDDDSISCGVARVDEKKVITFYDAIEALLEISPDFKDEFLSYSKEYQQEYIKEKFDWIKIQSDDHYTQ